MTEPNEGVPEIDLDALIPESGVVPAPAPVEPVTPEPEPAPAPVPQFTEEIEQLKAGYEEKLANATALMEAQTSRMNTLEQLVNQGYQAAHTPAPEPEVPKFTQEELLKDPIGTLERVSDAKARAAVTQNNEQITQVVGSLVERSHQAELKALEGRKYYSQVKEELAQVFVGNPALKMQANSAELAYNMIVGKNIETLEKGAPAPVTPVTPVVPRTPVPVPTGGAPVAPAAPVEPVAPAEPELTEAQKRLQAKFAAIDGIDLTAKDFD